MSSILPAIELNPFGIANQSGIGELPLQSFTKLFKVPNLAGPTLNCRFQNNPDLQIRSKYTLDMKSCRFCKVNETTIRHG
jgi:hypothetical protein